ncbi:MAG: ABC transporter substrate-binding protein [Chloroflexi bacterium]|nr:ABC transporter substrate-binding protein [Chloroflexota bacterium]
MRVGRLLMTIATFLLTGAMLVSCAPAVAPVVQPSTEQAAKLAAPTSTKAAAAPTKPPAAVPTPAATPRAAGTSPRSGGSLPVSSAGEPPSFDTHQDSGINIAWLVASAYNNLTEYDAQTGTKIVPGLAESWDMTPDGLAYTFRLRPGVKWHDGKPLTVDDVLLSLQRISDPPRGVRSNVSFLLKPVVQKIEPVSENAVRVSLSRPFAPLIPVISFAYAPIFPKHVLEAKGGMAQSVVGTGPFKFKSYSPGVSFEAVRNGDYWVPGKPYLDGVNYFIVKDAATRLAALRTGRVLVTGRVGGALNPNELEVVQKEVRNITLFPEPSMNGSLVSFNTRKEPFSDVRVRKAVSLVLDRQAARDVLAQGKGTIGTSLPFTGWGLEESELAKLPGFRKPKTEDIAEAKTLLSEAGYAQGLRFTITSRARPEFNNAAVFLAGELRKVGIDAKVEAMEDVAFYDRVRIANFDVSMSGAALVVPDPEWMGRYFMPGSGSNYSGNDDDKKLIEMWEKQQRAVEIAERQKMTKELDRYLLVDALPGMVVVWYHRFIGVWPQVKGITPGVSGYSNINFQEVWLDR